MSMLQRVSAFNRSRKWKQFMTYVSPSQETRVLDVGFNEAEWSDSDNYIERHYPWPENLTALGMHKPVEFLRRYPRVRAIQYDGMVFPFADQEFDVVWSNAVLEHVGNFGRQVEFVKEMKRVGKNLFFSTPNRGFPIELHTYFPFLHWLPKSAHDTCLRRLGRGDYAGDYMHLLTHRGLQRVLSAAGIRDYRIFRNRMCGWTMDFAVWVGSR